MSCLELRVWLNATNEHGQAAAKKLAVVAQHLEEMHGEETEAEP